MQGKVMPEPITMQPVYVGIDVCKEWLDVHLRPSGEQLRVTNDRVGLRRLKRLLSGLASPHIVMEATGKFHRAAQRSLHASGLRVATVDPLRARKRGGGPPEQALRFFEKLYRVERQARDKKPEHGETRDHSIRRFRQQHSIPVLSALKEWLDEIAPKVLPDSKLGDAVTYTLNQWEYLKRYTKDGRMPIDNNLLERDIRIFATGRKSWLFSDTVDGARASAVIYSLMLTCRACGVEPLVD